MELNDKVAIVTGGSSDIGLAIIEQLLEADVKIIGCYHNRPHKLEGYSSRIKIFGGDLSTEQTAQDLVDFAIKEYGRLDILINCAGYPFEFKLENGSKEDWNKALDANFYTAVFCTKSAIKVMEGGSKIINITSVIANKYFGRVAIIAYSAAKAALENFTLTIAGELAPKISVNAVSPGRTRTDNYDQFNEEEIENLKLKNKTGRFIRPDEIADGVLFVLKNDSIIGEIININAGFMYSD